MKNIKKFITSLVALGIVSTMGVSVFANDTIGVSTENYLNGDMNLDGKINALDLLLVKKTVLRITPVQQMYIEDGVLKLVEKGISLVDITVGSNQSKHITDIQSSVITIYDDETNQDLLLHVDKNTKYINLNSIDALNDVYKNSDVNIQYDENSWLITSIEVVDMFDISFSNDNTVFYLNGDINFDGTVDALDLLNIKKNVLKVVPKQEMYIEDGVLKFADNGIEIIPPNNTQDTTTTETTIAPETTQDTTTTTETTVTSEITQDTTTTTETTFTSEITQDTTTPTETTITSETTQVTTDDNSMPNIDNSIVTIKNISYYFLEDNSLMVIKGDTTLMLTIDEDTACRGIDSIEDLSTLNSRIDVTYDTVTNIVSIIALSNDDVQNNIESINNSVVDNYNADTKELTVYYTEMLDVDGEVKYVEKNITLKITDDTELYNINDINELSETDELYLYIEYNSKTLEVYILEANSVPTVDKPVIYLYPTEQTKVDVTLDLNGELTCTYPKYENGWSVIAEPDGTLYDMNGNEYYCLYWEGTQNVKYDFSKGFVVKGEDTAQFLHEKLLYMGLTPKEANEFIIYWLPKMENNAYNLITFQGDTYTNNAKLNITPTPDSLLRIFMAYKPLDTPINIEPQELSTFERNGFVAVEWGGTEVK